jgi:hypothetical protein
VMLVERIIKFNVHGLLYLHDALLEGVAGLVVT